MRIIRYTPEEVEVLTSCLLLAREAFAVIRNLGSGRCGLYEPDNPLLATASDEKLRHNLNIAGQLAEALHNLPYCKGETNDLEYTQRCMEVFLSNNPQFDGQYRLKEFLDRLKESALDTVDIPIKA